MMNKGFGLIFSLFFLFFLNACTTSGPGLFGKQSPRDKYAQKLTDAGLQETAMGSLWFSTAEQALANPVTITLPYKEISYFDASKPRAVGLQFSGKRGEKLVFKLTKNPSGTFNLFADLWEVNASAKPSFLRAVDTSVQTFELDIEDNNTAYILRLQPELLKSMDYELSISIAPSLAFPVAGKNARIASLWGDARDAGARRHEGIDIFAPKRTPALAAEDGTVTAVNENRLGGRVVWLRPQGKNYTLYYAHLDEQLTTAGQRVTKGDTIGLIGNTGNARSTPAHLHFGIYSFGGAIDPLPFVNPTIRQPTGTIASINLKEDKLRLTKSTTLSSGNYAVAFAANTVLQPISASTNAYQVALPDNRVVAIDKRNVAIAKQPIRQASIKRDTFLLASPLANAPRKKPLSTNSRVAVMGTYDNFLWVTHNNEEGWITATSVD